MAAERGHTKIITLLVLYGANINRGQKSINSKPGTINHFLNKPITKGKNISPLKLAQEHPETVKFLHTNGAKYLVNPDGIESIESSMI